MGEAEGCDAGIVNLWAGQFCATREPCELEKMSFCLREENEGLALEPVFEKGKSGIDGTGRAVDAGVGRDADELVDAGPGNRPGGVAVAEMVERGEGWVMKRGVLPMGVDEDVGIQGDHERSSRLTRVGRN